MHLPVCVSISKMAPSSFAGPVAGSYRPGGFPRNLDIDEERATELIYQSELYAQLEDETTKLWHLSPLALHEMFCEEQETGKITYPEEA